MSFATIETSADDGRPIELLQVACMTDRWYFTTSELPVVYDGHEYLPLPMSRDEVAPSGDVAKASLTIRVPQDCPVGELFRVHPPSSVVTVTLFAKHVDDAEVKVIWKGRIVNCEWEQPWLSMTTENVFSSLQRLGLRRAFSSQCPHPLYSTGSGLCNVDKAAYEATYTCSAISGLQVTCSGAAGRPLNYFAGGFATWSNVASGYIEKRLITSSDGSGGVVLASLPMGLIVGSSVTLYPGCDKTLDTCRQKFSNELNFGGMPYIPKKNPFGGASLY